MDKARNVCRVHIQLLVMRLKWRHHSWIKWKSSVASRWYWWITGILGQVSVSRLLFEVLAGTLAVMQYRSYCPYLAVIMVLLLLMTVKAASARFLFQILVIGEVFVEYRHYWNFIAECSIPTSLVIRRDNKFETNAQRSAWWTISNFNFERWIGRWESFRCFLSLWVATQRLHVLFGQEVCSVIGKSRGKP